MSGSEGDGRGLKRVIRGKEGQLRGDEFKRGRGRGLKARDKWK